MNQPLIGVILAQIGTPDAPDAKAVRPYLRRFLSDRRIIDYPPLLWQPLLRGIILRVRPRKSAALYSSIWHKDGSPLLLHSQARRMPCRRCWEAASGSSSGSPTVNRE